MERKSLWDQRQHVRATQQLIEKAKGVDIALAVQMLEGLRGSSSKNAISTQAMSIFFQRLRQFEGAGKRVYVYGYADGLSEQSPFLHDCDEFIDLEDLLRNERELCPPNDVV